VLQPGYMPPLGASPYTWPNIFKNMKRMDYCVDKFDFLGNREVCTPLNHFFCVEQGACVVHQHAPCVMRCCFAFLQDVLLQWFLFCLWLLSLCENLCVE
jgi:hypothetical protein